MIITVPTIHDVDVEIDPSQFLEEVWFDALTEKTIQPCSTLNNIGAWLKAVPDEAIRQMSDSQRSLIADFFALQAERYLPAPKQRSEDDEILEKNRENRP